MPKASWSVAERTSMPEARTPKFMRFAKRARGRAGRPVLHARAVQPYRPNWCVRPGRCRRGARTRGRGDGRSEPPRQRAGTRNPAQSRHCDDDGRPRRRSQSAQCPLLQRHDSPASVCHHEGGAERRSSDRVSPRCSNAAHRCRCGAARFIVTAPKLMRLAVGSGTVARGRSEPDCAGRLSLPATRAGRVRFPTADVTDSPAALDAGRGPGHNCQYPIDRGHGPGTHRAARGGRARRSLHSGPGRRSRMHWSGCPRAASRR